MRHWPGRYTDRHGSEEVVFETDGAQLIRTTIRGVLFEGDSMVGLGPLAGDPPEAMFSLLGGDLWFCLLEWELPLPVEVEGRGVRPGALHCALHLGDPADPAHSSDEDNLVLTLRLDGREYRTARPHHDFEDALHELQRLLPPGARLKACIACAWSDYSPVGSGFMGELACFRDVKDAYRQVADKRDLFALWPAHTESVLETWLCEEFEQRTSHEGYRGPFPYPEP